MGNIIQKKEECNDLATCRKWHLADFENAHNEEAIYVKIKNVSVEYFQRVINHFVSRVKKCIQLKGGRSPSACDLMILHIAVKLIVGKKGGIHIF